MKKASITWLIISLIGILLFLFLLLELRSHDPYQWMKPKFDAIESHDMWNERKMLYLYFLTGCFISFIAASGALVYQKIKERSLKRR